MRLELETVPREIVLRHYDGHRNPPGNYREHRCTREPADAIRPSWNCPT